MIAAKLIFIASEAVPNDVTKFVPILLILFVTYVAVNEVYRYTKRVACFPGPKGLPLVGNLHQLRTNAAEKYKEWAQTFGPVFQVQLGNIPVLVVNSATAAKVILGNNSHATASRPELYTFHKLVSSTAGTTIGTSPYSDSLKRKRKVAASALNRPSVETYVPHLDLETRDFLAELLRYGHAGAKAVYPIAMVQRLSLSLSLTLNWGTRMPTQDSALFHEITHVELEISRFRSTTDNLQDYIPLLRLNPFSKGLKRAAEMRKRRDIYLTKLNRDLAERVAQGTHQPCIQANVMLDQEAKLNDAELTSISLTMLSGGFETVASLMTWVIAFLATRPDIQEQAYSAICEHYKTELPLCDPHDDQKVPYIRGLVRESLRYFSILRLSLPRAANKEFTYEGRTIPKGTLIFLNTWACNYDQDLWHDPQAFRPDRWIEEPEKPMFTFGMGYRMCAGSLLANRELYLTLLRLIASFTIVPATSSKTGQAIFIDADPLTGVEDLTNLTSTPKAYEVRFEPRDEGALREALGVDIEKKG